jgi:hypothetical protein
MYLSVSGLDNCTKQKIIYKDKCSSPAMAREGPLSYVKKGGCPGLLPG